MSAQPWSSRCRSNQGAAEFGSGEGGHLIGHPHPVQFRLEGRQRLAQFAQQGGMVVAQAGVVVIAVLGHEERGGARQRLARGDDAGHDAQLPASGVSTPAKLGGGGTVASASRRRASVAIERRAMAASSLSIRCGRGAAIRSRSSAVQASEP